MPEIERDWARWGFDFNTYDDNVDYLKNFIRRRTEWVLIHTKDYFDLSDTAFDERFGDLP
jgi:hypothetical protein